MVKCVESHWCVLATGPEELAGEAAGGLSVLLTARSGSAPPLAPSFSEVAGKRGARHHGPLAGEIPPAQDVVAHRPRQEGSLRALMICGGSPGVVGGLTVSMCPK